MFNGRLSAKKVLQALAQSKVSDVIVVGKNHGDPFVACSPPSTTPAHIDALIEQLQTALKYLRRQRRARLTS